MSLKRIVLDLFYSIYYNYQVVRISKYKNNNKIYVFDIDNTLTVFHSFSNSQIRSIPRESIIKYVRSLLSSNYIVLFLSARHIKTYYSTKRWLTHHKILSSSNCLFLVSSVEHKIKILETLINNNELIEYVDDLSYNHENGLVLFYNDLLKKVKDMKLIYRDINFINSF